MPPQRRGTAFALAAGVGVVGIIMMHYPMIVSGLRRMQINVGDSRLINYFLEHNYRWFRGDRNHARIWDPPFFYPARNVAALSDTMTATAPIYAAFRAAGCAADTSFQLWMMAISSLNYAVAFHLLRCRLRMSVLAASAGAFLFAFGNPRVWQLGHQQLMPQFLSLVTIDALFGIFTPRNTPAWQRMLLWAAAMAGVVAQLTTGAYLGWFLIFALGIATAVALWVPSTRRPFLAVLWRDAPWIATAAALGAPVLRNWISHQLDAGKELQARFPPYVYACLPRPLTWLYVSPDSWLEGWSTRLIAALGQDVKFWEPCGVGLVTTVAGVAGLILARDRQSVRLLGTVALVVFLSVTILPPAPLLGVELVLAGGSLAMAYDRRRDDPWIFVGVVGLVLAALIVSPFTRSALEGIGLFSVVISVAAFVGWDGGWPPKLALGGLIAGLILSLMPAPLMLAYGAVFGGLLATVAAVAGWRARRQVEAVGLGALVLFCALVNYWGRPTVFGFAVCAALALAATRLVPVGVRPSAWGMLSAAGLGLGLMVVFGEGSSAWPLIYMKVPGANAMLFVSRVGLMMLIPWAIGLGFFLDALIARRRLVVAVCLAAICLAEQGVPTLSFDKQQNRDVISSLAPRVDKQADAFYYSPRNSSYPSWKANLDAMWAGLECGIPTLNGYSGGIPFGWRQLADSNVRGPDDLKFLQEALEIWRKNDGRTLGRLWWVGGPSDGWVGKRGRGKRGRESLTRE